MNQILNVIEKRRSVRVYSDQLIKQEEKNLILQATMRAPTAGNMMLYSIIEIEDQVIKDQLAVTCDNQPFIAKAPWVLLFLADYQRWWDYYQHCQVEQFCKEKGFAYRKPSKGDMLLACCDALIAAQTAVIAAESLGIGSCYIGDILENYETHRELLSLPSYVLPVTLLCFGRPAAQPVSTRRSPRFDCEFVVYKNKYNRLDHLDFERMFQVTESSHISQGWSYAGAHNFGQFNYQRKFIADFSLEMNHSVKEMLKNWD
jgi:nitroreductase